MSARASRARRLVAIESLRVGARERALAEAERAAEESEATVVACEAALSAACARAHEATSSEELANQSAYVRRLEAHVARARRQAAERRDEVRGHEAAAIAARVGRRRIEIMAEGFERADTERARKVERRAADEHAARKREA